MGRQRHDMRSWNARRHLGWSAILMVLAICLIAPLSWAGGMLKLGSLLANPESYQSKIVRVEGIVANHQLKHIKRWANNVDRCVQIFTVTDGTGTMQAEYGANCAGAMDLVRNRDRVTLEARFDWTPGKAGVLNVQEVLSKMAM